MTRFNNFKQHKSAAVNSNIKSSCCSQKSTSSINNSSILYRLVHAIHWWKKFLPWRDFWWALQWWLIANAIPHCSTGQLKHTQVTHSHQLTVANQRSLMCWAVRGFQLTPM